MKQNKYWHQFFNADKENLKGYNIDFKFSTICFINDWLHFKTYYFENCDENKFTNKYLSFKNSKIKYKCGSRKYNINKYSSTIYEHCYIDF